MSHPAPEVPKGQRQKRKPCHFLSNPLYYIRIHTDANNKNKIPKCLTKMVNIPKSQCKHSHISSLWCPKWSWNHRESFRLENTSKIKSSHFPSTAKPLPVSIHHPAAVFSGNSFLSTALFSLAHQHPIYIFLSSISG